MEYRINLTYDEPLSEGEGDDLLDALHTGSAKDYGPVLSGDSDTFTITASVNAVDITTALQTVGPALEDALLVSGLTRPDTVHVEIDRVGAAESARAA